MRIREEKQTLSLSCRNFLSWSRDRGPTVYMSNMLTVDEDAADLKTFVVFMSDILTLLQHVPYLSKSELWYVITHGDRQ